MAARFFSPVVWSKCIVCFLVASIPLEDPAGTQCTLHLKPAGRPSIANDLQHQMEKKMVTLFGLSLPEFRNSVSYH